MSILSDDRVAWTEVTDEESDTESSDGEWERAMEEASEPQKPLLEDETSAYERSQLTQIKRNDFDKCTSVAFLTFPFVMICVNMLVFLYSFWNQLKAAQIHIDQQSGNCMMLPYYVRATSFHAAFNVVLFSLYLARIYNAFCSTPKVGISIDQFGTNWLEKSVEKMLVISVIVQLVLGILGEIGLGGMGVGPALLYPCVKIAPDLFRSTMLISIYENSIILFLVLVAVRKLSE